MYLNRLGDVGAVTVTNAPLAFNSTKYPGICKPSNTYTLGVFKNLQNQLNRLAQSKGVSKIAADGDIGAGTIGLMSKLGLVSSGTSCSEVAIAADIFAAQAKAAADVAGTPAKVPSPTPSKPPTLVDAAGGEILAPKPSIAASVIDGFTGMSTIGKIAAVGILGGIGYFMLGKPKKRKGR